MLKWIAGGIAAVVLSVGLWAFEPWRLWTSSTIDEALPGGVGAEVVVATAAPEVREEEPARPEKKEKREKSEKNSTPESDPTAEATAEPSVTPAPVPATEPSAAPTSEPAAPEPKPKPAPAPEPEPEPEPEEVPEILELGSGEFVDAEHDTSGVARILQLRDGSRFVRLEGLDTSDGPDLFVGLSDAPSGGSWGSYDDDRYVSLGELKATNGNQNYEIPADVDLDGLTTVVIWCDRFNVAFGTADVA